MRFCRLSFQKGKIFHWKGVNVLHGSVWGSCVFSTDIIIIDFIDKLNFICQNVDWNSLLDIFPNGLYINTFLFAHMPCRHLSNVLSAAYDKSFCV